MIKSNDIFKNVVFEMVPKLMEIIIIAQNDLIRITGVVFLVITFFFNTNLRVYVYMLKYKYKRILKILSFRRDRVETIFKFDIHNIKDQCSKFGQHYVATVCGT